MMDEIKPEFNWPEEWGNGHAPGWFLTALDVIAPVAPIASQVLWVMQPIAGTNTRQAWLANLARALEEPDGAARLRQHLEKDER